jgi:hypothetical protein
MATTPRASPGTWYLEHLSEGDLVLLSEAARRAPEAVRGARPDPRELRAFPGLVEELLAAPAAFELVFAAGPGGSTVPAAPGESSTAGFAGRPSAAGRGRPAPTRTALLDASPFLVFALAVHRLLAELRGAGHVAEFAGPRRRIVVLGTADLVEVLAEPWRRLYLVELLASFTHVASGSVLVRTRRGLRRQRFSELDPVRLASLLEVLPEVEHAGVYRRLGDLALFLTGVFPDHTALRGLGEIDRARLWRSTGAGGPASPHGAEAPPTLDLLGRGGAVGLLEELGSRWYRLAARRVVGPASGTASVLDDLAARFGPARRALNVLTDRYLLPRRGQLFGTAD